MVEQNVRGVTRPPGGPGQRPWPCRHGHHAPFLTIFFFISSHVAGDRGVGVEDLKHPLRGGGGLLAGGEDVAERLHRPHQLQPEGDVGDKAADGHLVLG